MVRITQLPAVYCREEALDKLLEEALDKAREEVLDKAREEVLDKAREEMLDKARVEMLDKALPTVVRITLVQVWPSTNYGYLKEKMD